jgi:hypothetical protein
MVTRWRVDFMQWLVSKEVSCRFVRATRFSRVVTIVVNVVVPTIPDPTKCQLNHPLAARPSPAERPRFGCPFDRSTKSLFNRKNVSTDRL